jgi:hypothetical protein
VARNPSVLNPFPAHSSNCLIARGFADVTYFKNFPNSGRNLSAAHLRQFTHCLTSTPMAQFRGITKPLLQLVIHLATQCYQSVTATCSVVFQPVRSGKNTQGKYRMVEPENHGSYVARIWLEGSDKSPTWRGHLRCVQGEEECYFQNLSQMREFLERISGVPFPGEDND